MTELYGLRRSVARLLPPTALLALLCALALGAGPARASSSTQPRPAPTTPLPIPRAFRLPASNGYTLSVVAAPPTAGSSGSLLIFASAKGKGAFYKAPATLTETSMQADLGELGEISVSFHRTGESTSASCGKETIAFDSGEYEGKIDFHGEEGYTSLEASAAPGNIDYFLSAVCGTIVAPGPPGRARGAALFVRNPALGPQLSVRASRPGAAAQIAAWTSEYSNGIRSERFVRLRMPGEDFSYDRRLRSAIVSPPAPFAGSARFDLGKKAGRRWSGDLTVDLPGRAGVPLTGPALRATLGPSW